jgi:hypothetical protein
MAANLQINGTVDYEIGYQEETEYFDTLFDVSKVLLTCGLSNDIFKSKNRGPIYFSHSVFPDTKKYSDFRKAMRALDAIGYVSYKGHRGNPSNAYIITGCDITIADDEVKSRFLSKDAWYEVYIMGVVRTIMETSFNEVPYELATGVTIRLNNNDITDCDVLLAVGNSVFYIETKVSAYKGKEYESYMNKYANHIELFGFSPVNACFVCLNKTDEKLAEMRTYANGRFHVHDNRSFPMWIENRIREVLKK